MRYSAWTAPWAGMIAGMMTLVAAIGQSDPQAATKPGQVIVSTGGGEVNPRVDSILRRMEARKVKDLHAKLTWDVEDALAAPGDALDRKRGEIWYQTREPVPVFLVKFRERISNDRKEKMDEQYLFDGTWYHELRSIEKTVTRRQVRRANEPSNPYRLGEGPFPVPFGQTRDDILRELDVQLLPNDKSDPKGTDHLLLSPREGTQLAGKYGEIHFWVQQAGREEGLPLKVRVGKLDGTGRISEWMTIEFSDAEMDRGVPDKLFVINVPSGWEEVREPMEEP